ncbi:MAG: PKD domain-containing protein [Planctomycetota bacterium]
MKKYLLLLILLAPPQAAAQKTPWWDRQWQCRREAEVQVPKPKYEGDEVGYVEFRTGGYMRPDGGDIRVLADRDVIPHMVVQAGPGDYAKIAFRLAQGAKTYHIYYGNAKAEKPAETWEPKRGLLLEVRQFRGPGFQTWGQMQQSLDRAKELVMGRTFAPNVFLGYNPFGETANYIAIYTGWLAIPSRGDYVFATTSDDASFLFLDDKLLVSWPGTHRAAPYAAQFEVARAMQPGLHKFAYYHAQAIDQAAAVAAWLPPWSLKELPPADDRQNRAARLEWMKQNRFEVIPASAFPPVTKGVLKDYRVHGAQLAPDFEVENVGEAAVGEEHIQRIKFTDATTPVRGFAVVTQRWDFGDGNTATGSPVEHVYLRDGAYKVTLTIATAAHHFSVTQTVYVTRDWERQTRPATDDPKIHLPNLSKYEFEQMPPEHLVVAARYFGEMEQEEMVVRLCKIALARAKDAPVDALYEMAMLLGKAARDAETGRVAVQAFHDIEARSKDMRQQAALALAAGETSLNVLHSPDLAEKDFSRAATTYASADREALRKALVGLGDVYREKGVYERAKECYDKAAEIQIAREEFRKTAVQVGAYSRAVDNYLRDGKLDEAENFLDAWEWEFPPERLRGYSSLLRGRLLTARGDHGGAARELERLVLVNPRSPHAAECLLLAAECYLKAGDRKKAVAALRQAVNECKDSPLHPEAVKQLEKLEE